MVLQGKNIVIFIEQQYQDLEVWVPYYRLKEEGANIIFAAPKSNQIYKGKYGVPATSQASITDISAEECDAVIIPGGQAPDNLRREKGPVEFIKAMHDKRKVIASICRGALLLASAEIIRGKRITSYSTIKDDVTRAGALYKDQEVVVEENIITSRTPDDLPAFCKAIISKLS